MQSLRVRWIVYALPVAAYLLSASLFLLDRSSGTASAMSGFPLDDSWIHLVYSQSLAHGGGFAYNPGQLETGFTSPLWVVVLAPLFWIPGLDDASIVLATKAVGALLAVASCLLACRLGRVLSGSRVVALVTGTMLAIEPDLVFASLSGMEVTLAVTCVLWTLLAIAEKRPGRAGIGLAACLGARPELGLLAPLAMLAFWKADTGQPPWKKATLLLVPFLLAGAAWSGHNLWVTGHPLPATFYAKHRLGGGKWDDIPILGEMVLDMAWFTWWTGFALFAWGAFRLLRTRLRPGLVILAAAIAFPLAIGWAHNLQQEWPFIWKRYFIPSVPFLYVPVALVIGSIPAWLRARRFVPAVAALALALPGAFELKHKFSISAYRFSQNSRNIEEVQVALGNWVRDNVHAGEYVATNDAGAIRFIGRHPTVDLVGLNNHEILFGDPGSVLKKYTPRFFLVFTSWYPAIRNDPRFLPIHSAQTYPYTICDCGMNKMVVYEYVAPY
jgi:hypothetical protein